jgi:soluble epoxide hydrolase / lipid-phosphate phosphatase
MLAGISAPYKRCISETEHHNDRRELFLNMISQILSSLLFTVIAGASTVLDTPPFNSSLFKDLNVTRGLQYHYYAVPANTGKPTLLFLHGYPSTSYDWRHQVAFFQDKGYGLIVPDMLGYGGTAKPLDPQLYVSSLVTKDIVDILDAEGIDQAVVIGHDW